MKKSMSKGQFDDFLTTEERTAVRRKHDKQMAESNARIAKIKPCKLKETRLLGKCQVCGFVGK